MCIACLEWARPRMGLEWARPSVAVGFTEKNVHRGAHSPLGRSGGSADDDTVWLALWRRETVTVSGLDSCLRYILPCLWLRLLPLSRVPLCLPPRGATNPSNAQGWLSYPHLQEDFPDSLFLLGTEDLLLLSLLLALIPATRTSVMALPICPKSFPSR